MTQMASLLAVATVFIGLRTLIILHFTVRDGGLMREGAQLQDILQYMRIYGALKSIQITKLKVSNIQLRAISPRFNVYESFLLYAMNTRHESTCICV